MIYKCFFFFARHLFPSSSIIIALIGIQQECFIAGLQIGDKLLKARQIT